MTLTDVAPKGETVPPPTPTAASTAAQDVPTGSVAHSPDPLAHRRGLSLRWTRSDGRLLCATWEVSW